MSRFLAFVFAWLLISCEGSRPRGLDYTFSEDGLVTTAIGSADDEAFAVAVQSDGKVILAGRSFSNGQSDFALARYNTTGILDSTFGTGGIVTTDFSGLSDVAYAIAINTDGTLVAAGSATTGGTSIFALAKYESNGTLDSTFGTRGKLTIPIGSNLDEIHSLLIQPNGYILASGFSRASNYDIAIVRLNSAGTLDTNFDTDGKRTFGIGSGDDRAYAMALQSDGKIVLGGSTVDNNRTQVVVARLGSDGSTNSTFGSNGFTRIASSTNSGDQDIAFGLSVLFDGSIVAAGKADNGSASQIFITSLTSAGLVNPDFNTSGKLLTNFSTSSLAISGYANAQTILANGNVIIAGKYTSSSGDDFGLVSIDNGGFIGVGFGSGGRETINFGSTDEALALATFGSVSLYAAGKAHNGSNYDFALAKYFQ